MFRFISWYTEINYDLCGGVDNHCPRIIFYYDGAYMEPQEDCVDDWERWKRRKKFKFERKNGHFKGKNIIYLYLYRIYYYKL